MTTDQAPPSRPTAFSTPWYHGWNVIAVMIVCQAVTIGAVLYGFTLWVGPLMKEFNASRAAVLLTGTLVILVMGLSGPFVGRIIDKTSPRAIIFWGLGGTALGFLLTALTTHLWQVWVLHATIIGVALTMGSTLPGQALAVRWFRYRQGFALGLMALGTSAGGFALPPVITALMENFGWRWTYVALAIGIVGLFLPLTYLVVRDPGEYDIEPKKHRKAGAKSARAREHLQQSKQWTTLDVLRSRNYWMITFSFIPLLFAFACIQYNLAPIANDLNIQGQRVALVISILAGMGILGKVICGYIIDEVDPRLVHIGITVAYVVIYALLHVVHSFGVFLVLIAAGGFSTGGLLPLMGAMIASRFGPGSVATVFGLAGPFMMLPALGAIIAGWLRDVSGSYNVLYTVLTFVVMPSILFNMFLTEPKQPQPVESSAPPDAPDEQAI